MQGAAENGAFPLVQATLIDHLNQRRVNLIAAQGPFFSWSP